MCGNGKSTGYQIRLERYVIVSFVMLLYPKKNLCVASSALGIFSGCDWSTTLVVFRGNRLGFNLGHMTHIELSMQMMSSDMCIVSQLL